MYCPAIIAFVVFNMAAIIVKLHEVVDNYINNAANRSQATEISNEILQLSRAVVKKYTLESGRSFKYHLAQPSRMLSRVVVYWHKSVLRKMRRKTCSLRPWTVHFSWNLPLEVFECFKVVALNAECGGLVKKNTRSVEEIHIKVMEKLKFLFVSLANKYKSSLDGDHIFCKIEQDGSHSRIIVNEDHPAQFKYSKNLEILRVSFRYGYFNRFGVPQHALA